MISTLSNMLIVTNKLKVWNALLRF